MASGGCNTPLVHRSRWSEWLAWSVVTHFIYAICRVGGSSVNEETSYLFSKKDYDVESSRHYAVSIVEYRRNPLIKRITCAIIKLEQP